MTWIVLEKSYFAAEAKYKIDSALYFKNSFLINYAQREFGYTRPYSFAYERAFSDCFIYMYKSDICIATPPQQQRERSTIHGLNQSRISLPLKNETRLQIVQLLYEHRRRHAVLLSAFHLHWKKREPLNCQLEQDRLYISKQYEFLDIPNPNQWLRKQIKWEADVWEILCWISSINSTEDIWSLGQTSTFSQWGQVWPRWGERITS